jgi:hypothetical protein
VAIAATELLLLTCVEAAEAAGMPVAVTAKSTVPAATQRCNLPRSAELLGDIASPCSLKT